MADGRREDSRDLRALIQEHDHDRIGGDRLTGSYPIAKIDHFFDPDIVAVRVFTVYPLFAGEEAGRQRASRRGKTGAGRIQTGEPDQQGARPIWVGPFS